MKMVTITPDNKHRKSHWLFEVLKALERYVLFYAGLTLIYIGLHQEVALGILFLLLLSALWTPRNIIPKEFRRCHWTRRAVLLAASGLTIVVYLNSHRDVPTSDWLYYGACLIGLLLTKWWTIPHRDDSIRSRVCLLLIGMIVIMYGHRYESFLSGLFIHILLWMVFYGTFYWACHWFRRQP